MAPVAESLDRLPKGHDRHQALFDLRLVLLEYLLLMLLERRVVGAPFAVEFWAALAQCPFRLPLVKGWSARQSSLWRPDPNALRPPVPEEVIGVLKCSEQVLNQADFGVLFNVALAGQSVSETEPLEDQAKVHPDAIHDLLREGTLGDLARS